MKQINTSAIDCSYHQLQKRCKYTKAAEIDTTANHETRGIDLVHRKPDDPFVYDDDNLLVDESISRLFESLHQETNGFVLPPQRNVSIYEEDGLLSDASISELFDSLQHEISDGDGNIILVSNEDLIVDLSEEVEVIEHQQQQINNTTLAAENAKLKAEVASLKSIIQELQGSAVGNTTNGVTSDGRIVSLKAVKPIAQKYYDEHSVGGTLSLEHRENLRKLIKKEHAGLDEHHYYAKELMNDKQLDGYIQRLTSVYKEKVKRLTLEKLAEKKAILEDILSTLEKNVCIAPGSYQSAYVIQGIFVSHLLLYCIVLYLFVILFVSHIFP